MELGLKPLGHKMHGRLLLCGAANHLLKYLHLDANCQLWACFVASI